MTHSASAAVTADLPAPNRTLALARVLEGWGVDAFVFARSATPVDVQVTRAIFGSTFSLRPDLVPDAPLYIDDPTAPGGRRFNPAAFVVPADVRQGTLSRNALRGFPAWQLDLAIRRQFLLSSKTTFQLKVEVFNILNRPNFADPIGSLTNPLFGVSTQMLGRSLGAGGLSNGFSPLYQIGGPRSIQLMAKLQL